MIENFVSDNEVNTNQNLEPELKLQGFEGKQQQLPLPQYPKLAASINSYQDRIIFSQEGRDFALQINSQTGNRLKKVLGMMDGTNSVTELQKIFSVNHPEVINTLVHYLDENKLLDDAYDIKIESSLNTLLELESFPDKLLINQLFEDKFISIYRDSSDLQLNLIYGFAVEMYHFFERKAYIESSVLSFSGSIQIRQLINQFYCEEYGQDRLLLEALNSIDISDKDLIDTMALPQTVALCNSLAYWASFDSLFYFSILGVLVNQNMKNLTSYLQICEELNIDSDFLNPIRKLIISQQNSKFQKINHQIFQEMDRIDEQAKKRLKAQSNLFVEIYTDFYKAIFDYYSHTKILLRRVSAI
ncbi:MAG: hypothetical protein AAF915_04460 [Cyanobacteria bacterium P01_D01_bin.50]